MKFPARSLVKAISEPSGDQGGLKSSRAGLFVRLTGPVPSAFMGSMLVAPPARSLSKAILACGALDGPVASEPLQAAISAVPSSRLVPILSTVFIAPPHAGAVLRSPYRFLALYAE